MRVMDGAVPRPGRRERPRLRPRRRPARTATEFQQDFEFHPHRIGEAHPLARVTFETVEAGATHRVTVFRCVEHGEIFDLTVAEAARTGNVVPTPKRWRGP